MTGRGGAMGKRLSGQSEGTVLGWERPPVVLVAAVTSVQAGCLFWSWQMGYLDNEWRAGCAGLGRH